jgi:ribonucleoside-diphosphate reductase beta chain
LTAFNFITRYLREQEMLPGFVDGYGRIHHDEQRHIGYGTWYLQRAVERDPALGERVRQMLRDLLPAAASSLTPPERDGVDWDALGASGEEIRDFALNGLSRRLGIVGVPLASL